MKNPILLVHSTMLMKCQCINGSKVNGNRKPNLFSFALNRPPGHKIYKEPRVKLFKKITKSVLSHIAINLGDDDMITNQLLLKSK